MRACKLRQRGEPLKSRHIARLGGAYDRSRLMARRRPRHEAVAATLVATYARRGGSPPAMRCRGAAHSQARTPPMAGRDQPVPAQMWRGRRHARRQCATVPAARRGEPISSQTCAGEGPVTLPMRPGCTEKHRSGTGPRKGYGWIGLCVRGKEARADPRAAPMRKNGSAKHEEAVCASARLPVRVCRRVRACVSVRVCVCVCTCACR